MIEWVAEPLYGFLISVTLAVVPLFIASALISRKLARMIEAREWNSRITRITKAESTKKV